MAFGSILSEDVDSRDARKARGAFFTPRPLAEAIAKFAITSKDDMVLEPSCGEAEFLISAAQRLLELGAFNSQVDEQLRGNELHPESAKAAVERLESFGCRPTVTVGDFFELDPEQQRFDAVIGNPPYIRYQEFAGSQRAKARESAFAAGVRIDALASSWAPFVIHASRFLRRGGRLGFVLPAELLTVRYAAPVRRFLLGNFAKVKVTLFESPVFPEVQEEVVLLCAEGFDCGSSDRLYMSQVYSVEGLETSESFPASVKRDGRWPVGRAFQDAQDMLDQLDSAKITRLSNYGRIHLGAVSGANGYFAMSSRRAAELGLEQDDLRLICPPGSRHLRKLSLSSEDLARLDDLGKATLLFSPLGSPSEAGRRYIDYGEEIGVDKAYKCRTRNPWWRVPGLQICDLFFTYMNGEGPNLCFNGASVCFLNSVHGLFLDEGKPKEVGRLIPLAALSTLTLLSSELVGRSYGGGILKLEPREAGQIFVPTPEHLASLSSELSAIENDLNKCLSGGRRDEATIMMDEVLLPTLGMSDSEMQRAHGLLLELRARRERRSKYPKTRRG